MSLPPFGAERRCRRKKRPTDRGYEKAGHEDSNPSLVPSEERMCTPLHDPVLNAMMSRGLHSRAGPIHRTIRVGTEIGTDRRFASENVTLGKAYKMNFRAKNPR